MNFILLMWLNDGTKTFTGYANKEDAIWDAKEYWQDGKVFALAIYSTNKLILTEDNLR